jgi:hypothetical protein
MCVDVRFGATQLGSLASGRHPKADIYSAYAKVYIGLPLIIVAFGDTALVPGIIGAAITGAVFLPTGIVAAEIDRGKGNPTERSAISRFLFFL